MNKIGDNLFNLELNSQFTDARKNRKKYKV